MYSSLFLLHFALFPPYFIYVVNSIFSFCSSFFYSLLLLFPFPDSLKIIFLPISHFIFFFPLAQYSYFISTFMNLLLVWVLLAGLFNFILAAPVQKHTRHGESRTLIKPARGESPTINEPTTTNTKLQQESPHKLHKGHP